MLINVLRDEQPTHLAVAFDVSRATFRSEEYAEYKANRSKSPDEFQGQVSLIKEVLNALRVPFLEKPGFEADDVIGTLATQARAEDFEVLICSGDRDSFQLVDDRTTVIYPMRGVSEMKRMTPAAVEERYGVPPVALPRARRDRGGDLRQPAGRARGRSRVRRPLDQPVRRPRQRRSPTPRRSPARRGRRSASTSTT